MTIRRRSTPPRYRLHKASGQAILVLDGKMIYLGTYDTRESHAKYKLELATWLAKSADQSLSNHQNATVSQPASERTISEVILAFSQHALSYYSSEGGEFEQYKPVLRLLRECHGDLLSQHFGPKALKTVRMKMISKDWSRKVINRRITRIRTMFKWAESEELVPAGTTHALATVTGLKRGEQGVRDTTGVEPVFWEQLLKVIPHCSRTIQSMLQLQFLTGMRSGEVRTMRLCDIDTKEVSCWYYRPSSHKNTWRDNGQQRVIPLGPKCQEILRPWIAHASGEGYLFDPQVAVEEFNLLRTKGKRLKKPIHSPLQSRCYSSNTYAQSVARACKKAKTTFRAYGLRHGRKMIIERELGSEAARVVLGQKSIQSTQHYGKHDLVRAAEVMRQLG